jgi:hypothetical protein
MGTLHHVQRRSGRSEEGVSEPAVMAGILHEAQESCQPTTLAAIPQKNFFLVMQMKKIVV